MNVRLRSAVLEDAPTLARLGSQTFSETFGHLFQHHQEDLSRYLTCTFKEAKIRDSLIRGASHYWMALADDVPVGYARLEYRPIANSHTTSEDAQLQQIYVLRDYLSHRIGLPLLQAARCRARVLEAGSVWLSVFCDNGRAIRFYQKHGFVPFGKDTVTIGSQDFDMRLMRAELAAPPPSACDGGPGHER